MSDLTDEDMDLYRAGLARYDAEQAALPMYAITVQPCRFGWEAEANLHPKRTMQYNEPPLFWRPTRDAAVRAATRRIRRWKARDARAARTQVIVP